MGPAGLLLIVRSAAKFWSCLRSSPSLSESSAKVVALACGSMGESMPEHRIDLVSGTYRHPESSKQVCFFDNVLI